MDPKESIMTASTSTTSSTHDRVEGKVHEVKGAIKEKIGQMTNDPNLQDRGTAERIDGVIEKKVGDVKKIFGK
jgi:uncharacterized protein YjbJ (UPF0337 family)